MSRSRARGRARPSGNWPLFVLCCYTEMARIGKTSARFHIEVWMLRAGQGSRVKVTEAEFTFVALDGEGRPRRFQGGAVGAA